MSFKKEPQIDSKDLCVGCLNCSTAALEAPMGMIIAVGFGSSYVMKDDECIYDEQLVKDGNYWTVEDVEKLAEKEPDHDWRIKKHGPLHGETFQRHGPKKWVCIESNPGFA